MVKRLSGLLLMVLVLSSAATLIADGEIVYIELDGMIHNVTASYTEKAIDKGNESNAELIIIQINTPGGYATSMEIIIRKIMSSEVPVAVFIGPSGAKAASAGFFIALAADIVIMAPGTNTGAAHPVMVPLIPVNVPEEEDDQDNDKKSEKKKSESQSRIMAEKVLKDSIAYIKSLARARGRNIDLAVKAVAESESYEAELALKEGLIEFICNDIVDIQDKLDGYEVTRLDKTKKKLNLKGKLVRTIEMSWKDRFLSSLANPTLVFLLLIIAAVGIYAEFTHPGIIFPGVIGFVSLILFFFSAQILPVRFVGVLLILVAVILFILEVKIASLGLLTLGGIICMVLGGILLIDTPFPEIRVLLITIIPVDLSVAVIVTFLTTLIIRSFKRKVVTGITGMVGQSAVVSMKLNPDGKVFIDGEIWNAVSETVINKGEDVIIEKVDGMTLQVRKKQ